ncbi:hypothetical protein Tco_1406441 [Tanacetum coccineum]
MEIPEWLLNDDMKATKEYEKYVESIGKVVVSRSQPQPINSTQETNKIIIISALGIIFRLKIVAKKSVIIVKWEKSHGGKKKKKQKKQKKLKGLAVEKVLTQQEQKTTNVLEALKQSRKEQKLKMVNFPTLSANVNKDEGASNQVEPPKKEKLPKTCKGAKKYNTNNEDVLDKVVTESYESKKTNDEVTKSDKDGSRIRTTLEMKDSLEPEMPTFDDDMTIFDEPKMDDDDEETDTNPDEYVSILLMEPTFENKKTPTPSTTRSNRTESSSDDETMLIMEYLVKISKKARILELKRRHLKITVLTSNTPYPSRKIRRICACTSQKTIKETRSIRRIQGRPIRRIQAMEIKYYRRYQTWSLLQETPDTPY